MSGVRKVAVATFAQVSARLVGLVVVVAVAAVLTRRLGPTDFGLYSNALLYGMVAGVVCDLGIATIGAQLLQASSTTLRTGDVVRLKTVVQLPLFASLAALSPLLPVPGSHRGLIAVAILAYGLGSVQASFALYLQNEIRLDLLACVELANRILQLLLVLLVVRSTGSTLAAVLVSLAGAAFSLLAVVCIVVARGHDLSGRLEVSTIKQVLRLSLPLGVVTTVGYLHFKADSVLLSLLKSPDQLGTYSVAYRLIELYVTLPSLFIASALPLLARAFDDKVARQRNVQRCLDLLLVTGLPLIAGTFVCAPALVRLVGGDAFEAAVFPLRLLALASLFAWFNTLFGTVAILAKLQRPLLYVSLGGLALNVLLNALVIPSSSFRGAAVVTLVTEGLGALVVLLLVRGHTGLHVGLSRLGPTALTCLVAGAAAWPVNDSWISLAVFAVTTTVLLPTTRAVTRSDLRELLNTAGPATTQAIS